MRKIQPGDVAIVSYLKEHTREVEDQYLVFYDAWRSTWVTATHGDLPEPGPLQEVQFREVLVIDPENSTLMAWIAEALTSISGSVVNPAHVRQAMATLVRSPKVFEPDKVLAEVEDSLGTRWVKFSHRLGRPNWRRSDGGEWRFYADIDAVKVLSPGLEELQVVKDER